jgi:hypothetical protein
MKKHVLMKYLNTKGEPEYRSTPKKDLPDGVSDSRIGLMEVEAEEMLYTGEMKELLWIKSLNDEEHAQLMREESDARIKKLEELDKVWANI